jgi:hypothetical protein
MALGLGNYFKTLAQATPAPVQPKTVVDTINYNKYQAAAINLGYDPLPYDTWKVNGAPVDDKAIHATHKGLKK